MSEVTTVYPRIDAAADIVDRELDATATELEAFRDLRSRLGRLDATTTVSIGVGRSVTTTTSMSGIAPAAIREAYRETVMAMPHYDRDYGEPFIESACAEFGEGVGTLVERNVPIPPTHREVIDTAIQRAIDERDQFRRVLEGEGDSLAEVEDRLGEIERDLHVLRALSVPDADRAVRLEALAEACDELAAARQRSLHRRAAPSIAGIGERSLVEYLYGHTDHRFPALAEVTGVAQRVEAALDTEMARAMGSDI